LPLAVTPIASDMSDFDFSFDSLISGAAGTGDATAAATTASVGDGSGVLASVGGGRQCFKRAYGGFSRSSCGMFLSLIPFC
jgi:hypothetical protein